MKNFGSWAALGLLISAGMAQATIVYEEVKEDETVKTKPQAGADKSAEGKAPPPKKREWYDEEEEEAPAPPKTPPPPPVKVGEGKPGAPAAATPPPPLPEGQKSVSSGVFMIRQQNGRTEVVLRNGETYVIRRDSAHNQILNSVQHAEQTGGGVSLTVDAATGRILSATASGAPLKKGR